MLMASITRNTMSQNNSLGLKEKAEFHCSWKFIALVTTPAGLKDFILALMFWAALTLSLKPTIALDRLSDSRAKFHTWEEKEIFLESGSLEKHLSCLTAVLRRRMPEGSQRSIQDYTHAQKIIKVSVSKVSHLMKENEGDIWRILGLY